MRNIRLEMKLHRASLKDELKGRKTKPAIGLDDKGFRYTSSLNTNLAETFKRARAELGVLKTV